MTKEPDKDLVERAKKIMDYLISEACCDKDLEVECEKDDVKFIVHALQKVRDEEKTLTKNQENWSDRYYNEWQSESRHVDEIMEHNWHETGLCFENNICQCTIKDIRESHRKRRKSETV